MNRFLKSVLASIVGFVIAGGVLLILFFAVLFGMIGSIESSFDSKKKVEVKEVKLSEEKAELEKRLEEEPAVVTNHSPENKPTKRVSISAQGLNAKERVMNALS